MSDLPEKVTVQEQAQAAGAPPPDGPSDFVYAFDAHAKKVIENAHLSVQNRAMALSKLAELVYWLRTS
jgi:hypothetical protein